MKRNTVFLALVVLHASWAVAGTEDTETHYIYDAAVDAYNTGKYVVALDEGLSEELEQKLGRQLALAAEAAAAGSEDWAQRANISPDMIEADRVFVEITIDPSKADKKIEAFSAQYGGSVRNTFTSAYAEVALPAKSLLALSKDAALRNVALARRVFFSAGLTESVEKIGSEHWNNDGNLKGSGQIVGIIDQFDLQKWADQYTLQPDRTLPRPSGADTRPLVRYAPPPGMNPGEAQMIYDSRPGFMLTGTGSGGDFTHGNKVLEIIYANARLPRFLLFPAANTVGSLRDAFDRAFLEENLDALNLSGGPPIDGYNDGVPAPGTVMEKMAELRSAGTLVVKSAGNYAKSHWAGEFLAASTSHGLVEILDWNRNAFNDNQPITAAVAAGSEGLNVLHYYADPNGCTPNGKLVFASLGVASQNAGGRVREHTLRLLRQGAGGRWYPVATARAINAYQADIDYAANNASTALDGSPIPTDTGFCGAQSARYAVQVSRTRPINLNINPANTQLGQQDPVFINFFTDQAHFLTFQVPQGSLDGAATAPHAYTVGAAHCMTGSRCGSLAHGTPVFDASGRGPVLERGGLKPVFLSQEDLYRTTVAHERNGAKPNASAFSNVTTSLGALAGTSGAAPHVASMALLLGERWSFLDGNPLLLEDALNGLSKKYGASDAFLIAAGYVPGQLSYSYGMGFARLEVAAKWRIRGWVNHALVGRPFTTSPMTGSTPPVNYLDGSNTYRNSYGPNLAVCFLDRYDRPLLLPPLVPSFELVQGSSGTVAAGNTWMDGRFMLDQPPGGGVPDRTMGYVEWWSGHSYFPNFRVTQLPPAVVSGGGVGLSYAVRAVAKTKDGQDTRWRGVGEYTAVNFNVCTQTVRQDPRLHGRCPAE